jgi:hypothetical protein
VIKKAAAIAPAAKKTAVVASVGKSPMEKPMPFVIEPESLSAFVDHSDSVLSSTGAVRAAVPPPVTPAEAAKPEIATSIPSQPVVVEKSLAATIETAADWQVPNALEGHHIMNEAIETGKKFAEDAKARLQTLAVEFNDKAKAAMEKSSKAVEELSDITKGNVEALVESSKIAAKGVEAMGQSAAEYGRASFEKTSATLKSFASVKSPMEFFQLQSQLFTSTFDIMAAESAKSSEAFLKLAGEIAQPLSSRVAVVQDKLKALAA